MAEMREGRTTGISGGLELTETPIPEPAADEVLDKVEVCGICRTDLHVADDEIPVHRRRIMPGHQAIGTVLSAGSAVTSLESGAGLLALARNLQLRPTVTTVPFDGLAGRIDDLRRGGTSGSLVLHVAS